MRMWRCCSTVGGVSAAGVLMVLKNLGSPKLPAFFLAREFGLELLAERGGKAGVGRIAPAFWSRVSMRFKSDSRGISCKR